MSEHKMDIPAIRGFCNDLQAVIDKWDGLTHSEVIAGLDTVKVECQLEILETFGISFDEIDTTGGEG